MTDLAQPYYEIYSRHPALCTSPLYLSGYLNSNDEIPEISLDVVFKAAQIIESMAKKRLKSRINNELLF